MSIKTDIEAEKTKLLAELAAIEAKAKSDLAAFETKAKGAFDLSSEITAVESKVKEEVQKVEKWFVSHFKKQPVPSPAPQSVANVTPVPATANVA